ncbi:MAG TPA: hypothetical protein VFR47_06700 [Anaerolineales bacterium]|nr:hypothetical protein [Anaerolineales bacterium]
MNTSLAFPTALTRPRGLALIVTLGKARAEMTELIAELIFSGPLFLVAGSEWLPAFELTRMLRKRTVEINEITGRLRAARTATCFRLLDSLRDLPPTGEPILVLDFLHTFYDPDIPLETRFRILQSCCRELERLAFARPLIVTTREMATEDYEKFLPVLRAVTDQLISFTPEPEQVSQPTLF